MSFLAGARGVLFATIGFWAASGCSSGSSNGDASCSITYPPSGFYGQNILDPAVTSFQSTSTPLYEYRADVPLGYSLSFTMTLLGGTGGVPDVGPIWQLSGNSDFRFSTYDATTGQQRFMSSIPNANEGGISFSGTGQARIDIFECGAPAVTRTETITWAP